MVASPDFNYEGTYDENWPLPERLTLAQYGKVFFRPDAHFVDGQIVPRTLGDSTRSRTVGALIIAFDEVTESQDMSSCLSLRLQVSPTRVRVCDFVVLAADAPYEDVPTVPPLLCIEVITHGQSPADELDSLTDYLFMGVPNIWLINPIRRLAYTFDASGLHKATDARLTVSGSDLSLDLAQVFSALR